ncbi:MAG: anti-sigma factor [Pseudolabrys sp.]|jgi:anti-sigma-K factor RskA
MSETFDHNGLPDDELLAAELALGVLEGAERATAERRATRDRGFARLVEDWEHRLTPWAAEIAEISPPPQVWERISSALPAQPSRAGLWHNLTFWRGASLAAGALAAACLAALLYFGVFIQQQPLVATIEGGGQRHFVATIDSGRGTVAVVPAAFSPDATRVPELWLIPPDGRPRAVGMLHADQTVVLTLPPELAALAKNNAVLAVSLEPPGGSTTGLPTGPVIATGKLTSL